MAATKLLQHGGTGRVFAARTIKKETRHTPYFVLQPGGRLKTKDGFQVTGAYLDGLADAVFTGTLMNPNAFTAFELTEW